MTQPQTQPRKLGSTLAAIPRDVWALGFVSLFMDVSSEMIHSLLPLFLVSVLGASATAVGFLEGTAESIVFITKLFSGAISDWTGKRKPLALVGYGMAALTKPLFPIANSYAVVFAARVLDRIGKGIRGAPRDALIADISPKELRGASFGLRQSLDTTGAFIGPLGATAIMLSSGGNYRLVFWIAVIPALICVATLQFMVHEPEAHHKPAARPAIQWSELRLFPRAFWWVTIIGAVLTLARFSEAFLVLRAQGLGLAAAYVPMAMVLMNVVSAAASYPSGHLSDRIDRRLVLLGGTAALIAADAVLAAAGSVRALLAGISLWGLHMGVTQGLLSAMIADTAPKERRGTAFGVFNAVSGGVLLAASVIAGELWDRAGAPATFYAGGVFAVLASGGLAVQILTNRGRPRELSAPRGV